jgi:four helix bundle protein
MKLEDLNLYRECQNFEQELWNKVAGWEEFAKDTLGKKLVLTADSISSNIAQGYGRYFFEENRQFCYKSRGALLDTRGLIKKSFDRQLISEEDFNKYEAEIEKLHKMLNAYIRSIGKRIEQSKNSSSKENSDSDEYTDENVSTNDDDFTFESLM